MGLKKLILKFNNGYIEKLSIESIFMGLNNLTLTFIISM